jgi:hypothetical protein
MTLTRRVVLMSAAAWQRGEVQALTIARHADAGAGSRRRDDTLPPRLAAGQRARFERRDGRLQRLET